MDPIIGSSGAEMLGEQRHVPAARAGRVLGDGDAGVDVREKLTGDALSALLTFLIADVRGYTRFTVEHGDEAAARLATTFAHIAAEVIEPAGGKLIEVRGDEALAAFASARQALRAAVNLQTAFRAATRDDLPLRVGIGIDAGEAIPVEGGYRGSALNLAARLCSLAGPGEVLASETVTNLARKVGGLMYIQRGASEFKGFSSPVMVMQVLPAEAARLPAIEEVTTEEQRLPMGGFLGALPANPLVARSTEMDLLVAALRRAENGESQMVVLGGEPGVGKTRLAQEVTLHVRDLGFLLGSGRCYESEENVPYYPLREALLMLYDAAPAGLRAKVPQQWPYLLQLLPNSGGPTAASGSGEEDQLRLFYAVSGFVQALSMVQPVALLLDDLHWADVSSLKLLQFIARHTRTTPLFILATYRDVDVGAHQALERALRDLHREGLIEGIALRRLDRAGTAELMAATFGESDVSEEFVRLLYQHTEGNPFFTHEVLRALVERGDLYKENGRWERRKVEEIVIPTSVRSTVLERVSRLEAETQDLLAVASVLGQTFQFEEAQALSDRDEQAIEEALEAAETAGLIRLQARDTYAFNHALTQQVLYEEIPPRRQRRLHRAAGEAIEARPGAQQRAAELAWHFLEGGDLARAARYSLAAGDSARMLFAYEEAIGHYRRATELAHELGDEETLGRALESLGIACAGALQYDEALRVLERAADIYHRRRAVADESRVVGRIGEVHHIRGEPDAGITRVRRLLGELEQDAEAVVLAPLYVALAHLYFASGQYLAQQEAAERAATYADAAGDLLSLAAARMRLATAHGMLGQYEEAVKVMRDAIAVAEEAGDLHVLAVALNNLGVFLRGLGHPREAMVYRERALEIDKRTGDIDGLSYMYGVLGWAHFEIGSVAAAAEALEEAVKIAESYPNTWRAPYAYAHCGQWLVIRGEHERAERYLRHAVALGEKGADLQVRTYATIGLARLQLLRGDATAALGLLHPLLGATIWLAPEVKSMCAEAYAAIGAPEDGLLLAEEALTIAQESRNRIFEATVLRTRGVVLAGMGKLDEGVADLEASVERFRTLGMPFDMALSLRGSGLAQIGHDDAAPRERLEEALRLFRELEAYAYVDRTEVEIAALPS